MKVTRRQRVHQCTQLIYNRLVDRLVFPAMSAAPAREKSLLDKLDDAVPGLARFDAFPKLPSTYKARSESRGFLTLFVILLAVLLVLNDLAEYVWGWPDYEFSVDTQAGSYMMVNVDMVVNTPCSCMYPSKHVLLLAFIPARRRPHRGLARRGWRPPFPQQGVPS